MPIVRIEILEGRDDATRRLLAERLTRVVSETLGIEDDATHVIIEERPRANWARGGVRYSDR